MKDLSTNFHSFIHSSFPFKNNVCKRQSSGYLEDKLSVERSPSFSEEKRIKLSNSDGENSYASLKNGDKVKVKFGSRWYDAEVAEKMEPQI